MHTDTNPCDGAGPASSASPSLKIGILARERDLNSTERLAHACTQRGHEVRVIDYLKCHMNITSHRPRIFLGDEELQFDAVIPRIGASTTFFGTAVVRQFEMMGTFSLNESVAISRSRDKLRSLQLLARKGLGLPVSAFAHDTEATGHILKSCGGAPVVIKLLEGTQGVGVVLAETPKAAESVIEAFRGLDANILVQEFIGEAGGMDIHCFVVGDKVVASTKRQGREGEALGNHRRGGPVTLVKITPEERSTAVRAAKVMGLRVAGVEMLRSNHGTVITEVNSTPSLVGMESVAGKDVAASIIRLVERHAKDSTRTKGKG